MGHIKNKYVLNLNTDRTSDSVLKRAVLDELEPTPFDELDPVIYADWYLNSCYPEIPFHDEKAILDFLVSEAPKVNGIESMLELGCGPVVSHALPFVPFVDSFILSDYLDTNLELISKWVSKKTEAHNWTVHTAYVLRKEGTVPSRVKIEERESLLRQKIKALVVGDLLSKKPIRKSSPFPSVSCFYATEQAASDESEWLEVMQNLSSLVSPGGYLFLACLRDAFFYAIHDKSHNALRIPIVPITTKLVAKGLQKAGFSLKHSTIESMDVGGLAEEGIEGVILVSARKTE